MMSITHWLVLVIIFVGYLLFGATVFYLIESKEEILRLKEEANEKKEIEDLIKRNYVEDEHHSQNEIFLKISDFCDKPLGTNMPHKTSILHWTFYHSIFFVLTVISTIGYGNLAPTTAFTRSFVIIYGIIGIPMNGIVIITLGDYFGRTFLKVYKRWKNLPVHHYVATLGLIGKIILYSIPGFTLLIIIPSLVIVLYEGWTFDQAIEFSFSTLSTIGVGHVVPGTNENNGDGVLFRMYQAFLLLWILIGLGYLAMVFSFISRGLQSKQMQKLEHKIGHNIKKTNRKIRQELRSLLNEYLLMRVKPIYRERRVNALVKCQRTQSCPDLSLSKKLECCKIRKRAISELPKVVSKGHSDTNLQNIDKEQTFMFENSAREHNQLLLKVVNALSNYNTMACSTVTASEETDTYFDLDYKPHWSTKNERSTMISSEPMRPRAASESIKERAAKSYVVPWAQRSAARRMQEIHEREKYGKARSRTLPPIEKPQGILTKLKKTFNNQKQNDQMLANDIESQTYNEHDQQLPDYSTVQNDHILDETSLADFLRALTIINFREISKPHRKFGTAEQSSVSRKRRIPITPVLTTRKTSLMPISPSPTSKQRRFSLNVVPNTQQNNLTIEVLHKSMEPSTIQTDSFNSHSNTFQKFYRPRLKSASKIVDNRNKND